MPRVIIVESSNDVTNLRSILAETANNPAFGDKEYQALIKFCWRLHRNHTDAEDLAHETIIRCLSKFPTYSEIPLPFAYVVARNLFNNQKRDLNRHPEISFSQLEIGEQNTGETLNKIFANISQEKFKADQVAEKQRELLEQFVGIVDKALNKLKPKDAQLLRMMLDGYSVEDIAANQAMVLELFGKNLSSEIAVEFIRPRLALLKRKIRYRVNQIIKLGTNTDGNDDDWDGDGGGTSCRGGDNRNRGEATQFRVSRIGETSIGKERDQLWDGKALDLDWFWDDDELWALICEVYQERLELFAKEDSKVGIFSKRQRWPQSVQCDGGNFDSDNHDLCRGTLYQLAVSENYLCQENDERDLLSKFDGIIANKNPVPVDGNKKESENMFRAILLKEFAELGYQRARRSGVCNPTPNELKSLEEYARECAQRLPAHPYAPKQHLHHRLRKDQNQQNTTILERRSAFSLITPGGLCFWLAPFLLSYMWRFVHQRFWQPLAFWWEELFRLRIRATAGFASVLEAMTLTYKPELVYLGRLRAFGVGWWQSCGLRASKHLVMLAGTGRGKTNLLITLLGLQRGNAFVIDPKGQMAKVLASTLARKRKVCVLDPRRIVRGHRTATWNPFDEMARAVARQRKRNEWESQEAHQRGITPPDDLPRPEDIAVIHATKIADGLVMRHSKESPFWTNSAKDFLVGLILFVFLTEPPERRNLVRLYDLLCNGLTEKTPPGRNGFDVLLYEMTKVQAFGGIVAGSANTLANAAKETRSSIISTMSEALKWLKNPAVRNICQSSSFSLEELKTGQLTLFLCAPVSDIRVDMAGWFRLITVLSLTVFEELQHEPSKTPCLYALDEFPSLGHIDAIESSAAVMRSYGIRLLCIAQDIGQISNLYDNWQTFISSAAAVWYMSLSDPEILSYLEKSLGKSHIRCHMGQRCAEPPRIVEDEHTVITADQSERFLIPQYGNMIVQCSGEQPLIRKPTPSSNTFVDKRTTMAGNNTTTLFYSMSATQLANTKNITIGPATWNIIADKRHNTYVPTLGAANLSCDNLRIAKLIEWLGYDFLVESLQFEDHIFSFVFDTQPPSVSGRKRLLGQVKSHFAVCRHCQTINLQFLEEEKLLDHELHCISDLIDQGVVYQ